VMAKSSSFFALHELPLAYINALPPSLQVKLD
jgi:hypothetical protein